MTVTRGAQTVRAFTYDGAGNILTDNRAGATTTYTYSKRNRMETATSGALVWGYTYNGLEQLAVRNLNVGGTDLTHFAHDRFGNVIAESNGTGPAGTLREHIWLPEAEIAPTFGSRAQVDRPLALVEDVAPHQRAGGGGLQPVALVVGVGRRRAGPVVGQDVAGAVVGERPHRLRAAHDGH
jgi:YD repeat-containing protein